jgi:hypothetical protein
MAKKAKKKPAAKKKKKPFRREDIPNISPQLGDMGQLNDHERAAWWFGLSGRI